MKNTFHRSIQFRSIGFLLLIVAVTAIVIFQNKFAAIPFIILSFICDTQYKCPCCHKTLSVDISPNNITFCPKCGEKINEPQIKY